MYDVINNNNFPKGFHGYIKGHRYEDTEQLLSLLVFLPTSGIKRTILKIAVLENLFP